MDDLISRQALKNVLINWQMEYAEKGKDVERFETLDKVIDLVEQMSTAEPKKGKWILNKDGNWSCPFCEFDPYHDNMHGMNYCPNCGARLEQESRI